MTNSISVKTTPGRDSDILYNHLANKKRAWTPTLAKSGSVAVGSENTLDRAMCLRKLELPVGEFIKEGNAKEDKLSETCLNLLLSNVEDEIKHDIALENLYRVCGQHSQKHELEADQIVKAWLELEDHPFVKALYAERSIFFVLLPMFRFLGTNNISMRNVSAEISGDEIIHVSSNTEVCKSLKLEPSKQLDNLRKETMSWTVSDLHKSDNFDLSQYGNSFKPQYLNKDYWMRQSDMLFSGTKAPELDSTQSSRMPAFFEISRELLTSYS